MNNESTQTLIPSPLDVHYRLKEHEAVCTERTAEIMRRLARIERIFISVAGVLIVGLGSTLMTLILKL